MYERILVPLDGSKVGETALPYVEELVSKLAAVQKVKITLLQVVSSLTHPVVAGGESVSIPYTGVEVEQIKKKAMNYLNKTSKGLRSKGVVVNCKVAVGRAAEEIIFYWCSAVLRFSMSAYGTPRRCPPVRHCASASPSKT